MQMPLDLVSYELSQEDVEALKFCNKPAVIDLRNLLFNKVQVVSSTGV